MFAVARFSVPQHEEAHAQQITPIGGLKQQSLSVKNLGADLRI